MDAVFKNIANTVVKIFRHFVSEKLKDGDVTNQQLRRLIMEDIDNFDSKLDSFARSALKTSVSFFKEGLVFLKRALSTEISETGRGAEGREAIEPQACPKVIKIVEKNLADLVEKLRQLNLADLDESCRNALSEAKKKFNDAHFKATEAFNNDALAPSDRIFAMALRLMASILTNIENPGSALEMCRLSLEELHSAAIVRENFKTEFTKNFKVNFNLNKDKRREIISLVCQVNRISYDITLKIGETKDLFLLPCIDIGNEKVDPLRDARVAQMLRKVDMSDCSVVWSFGEENEKTSRSICGIATNTSKQFFVTRRHCNVVCVDVFDSNGTFLTSFAPSTIYKYGFTVGNRLATDRDGNIYVLTAYYDRDLCPITEISVFDQSPSFRHRHNILVGKEFSASTFIVKDNYLLVPGRFDPGRSGSQTCTDTLRDGYVIRCNVDGKRIGDFSEKKIGILLDITAGDDDYVMVLNNTSCVYVFALITANNGDDDRRHYQCPWYSPKLADFTTKFDVAPPAVAIAFHWPTGNLVIASSKDTEDRSRVSLYSMKGNLERSIDIELEDTETIQAAKVTTDGSICIATSRKVLVL